MANNTEYFRNTDKFTLEPISGQVSGKIPEWLEGTLIRNGPGVREVGPDHYKHLFDGMAVLHRFEIKDGKAFYQNRAVEGDDYKRNISAQRIVVGSFGTRGVFDPCMSLFDKFKARFTPGLTPSKLDGHDNCNVNVAFYGDQLYAMTESNMIRRIEPTSLETLEPKININDHISVNHATAHPHVIEDGSILNMGNNFRHKNGPHYCIIKVPPAYESEESCFKNSKILAEIPARWKLYPCYYHSFGMTTDKIVFVEQPYCISVPKIMAGNLMQNSFQDCLKWYPNQKTRIYIVPTNGSGKAETLVYETDNLFTFHHINAYEEDGNIIMDVVAYDDATWVKDIAVDTINQPSTLLKGASARRYILPTNIPKDAKPGQDLVNVSGFNAKARLRAGNDRNIVDVKPHKFTDFFEFPRINYKYNGKKYNFFYGVEASPERREASAFPEADIVTKFDIATGHKSTWTMQGVVPSEPIFVANPQIENPAEDDGILICGLLHKDDEKLVTLIVLDAKDMKELAQVRFLAEGPVSTTFHGQWSSFADKLHVY